MASWRSNSLRGGMGFNTGRGMGEIAPDYNAMIQQLLAQISNQDQALATTLPAAAASLSTLASGALDTAAGQQLLDQTLNALLADPVLRAKVEERAIAILWERYKVPVLISAALIAWLIYLAVRNNSEDDNRRRGQR